MIPKLAGHRNDGRGRSFKCLFDYLLHDKGRASTSRRVAWAEPINCALGGDVRRAWYEMVLTWENRAALKRAHGLAGTGRSNERPVLHLTLSWHPSETPGRDEMMDAARSVLDWLDLSDHQVVAIAHTDEPHPHLHLAINTVHPETGVTASLYQSKKLLSAWAAHWEETHGGIIVGSRAAARATLPAVTGASMSAAVRPAAGVTDAPALAAGNDNAPSPAVHRPRSLLQVIAPKLMLRARFMRAASLIPALTPLLLLFPSGPSPTGPPIARPPDTAQPATQRPARSWWPRYRI